ncbi:D-tyrosyl-tRNA(Tyr) deacylase [bacterium]|nr:MAG: D-tyrosyl-tRNA(Tyr) deacylase [bacterium]RIK61658.1 MAG: D-tyrosyl-tRNA(Tyr) deacylase [Planctomycetota bacterium]
MRVLVQRVSRAAVTVEGQRVADIGPGLLLLVGVGRRDTAAILERLASRCVNLRIFADDAGRMNRSVHDLGGEILAVSQFTLYGDASSGNRPGFTEAARPDAAMPLFEKFVSLLADKLGRPIATGRFGADMQVELVNDGPVTLWLEAVPDSA